MYQSEIEHFVTELDAAVQAHMEWTRRLLRYGILRERPADDVLKPDAHRLCQFGRWFQSRRAVFADLDEKRVTALESVHQCMHDATRTLCQCILDGRPGNRIDLDSFERSQSALIEHLAHFKTLAVARSSLVDAVTGLPMRHRISHDFDLLQKQVGRQLKALLVAMVDIDYFKRINDEFGHDAGDIVLRGVASGLRGGLRKQDEVYRFGGEEFLLLLPLSKSDHAATVANKLLAIIRELAVTIPNGTVVQPRATIGAAIAGVGEDIAGAIRRADAALYEGKESGRNRLVMSGISPVTALAGLPEADKPTGAV